MKFSHFSRPRQRSALPPEFAKNATFIKENRPPKKNFPLRGRNRGRPPGPPWRDGPAARRLARLEIRNLNLRPKSDFLKFLFCAGWLPVSAPPKFAKNASLYFFPLRKMDPQKKISRCAAQPGGGPPDPPDARRGARQRALSFRELHSLFWSLF